MQNQARWVYGQMLQNQQLYCADYVDIAHIELRLSGD